MSKLKTHGVLTPGPLWGKLWVHWRPNDLTSSGFGMWMSCQWNISALCDHLSFWRAPKLRVLLQQLMFGVLICQHWITSVKLADASKPTLADTGLQREEEAVVLEQCDCREGIQIYAVSSGSFSQTSLRKPVHFYGGHRWVPVPQGPTMSILLPWCCWSMELPRLKAGQPFRLLTDYSVKGGTPWARLSWLTWREDLSFGPQSGWFILKNLRSHWGLLIWHLGMDQYLLIPFLVGRTSIYQLFWCSPGYKVLTHCHFAISRTICTAFHPVIPIGVSLFALPPHAGDENQVAITYKDLPKECLEQLLECDTASIGWNWLNPQLGQFEY